ncbi:MAG: tetratricopeptide repeat protein [Alphaproteobacteria bacterium]|jgi:predicted ATPase|nr:tetratricopeptide repeat protein [Alphaproteobacteria bacterium]MDP6565699.1 tetratricopeptide repeat protein [Alphaproteobacteria bacterium]MDP6815801.1 tetratricopeptide repeat protein [Alphaproteobacteria bacterium]
MLRQFMGDVPGTRRQTETLIEICSRQPVPLWSGLAFCLQGWAIGMNGDIEAGLARLRQGYDGFAATGARLMLPYHNALMAEVHAAGAEFDAALGRLAEADRLIGANDEGWFAAELDRIHGDVLRQAGRPAEAETAYHRGLVRAREQEGLVAELRCAVGLAELSRQKGDDAAARDLIQPIYGQFNQALDSRELLHARTFLTP